MRLLVNENVSAGVIQALREHGHDILSAKESMRSKADEVILAQAQTEQRLVVTHDKDFGELAFRVGLPSGSGIILLRLTGTNSDDDNRRAIQAIESRKDWAGHFSVATDDRIRMRPLISPAAGEGQN
jgi:predicted nuclease of predicted toxin-antitoxin system